MNLDDLLIQTRHTLYECEKKIKKLKIPKQISVHPVLIYEGEIARLFGKRITLVILFPLMICF